MASLRRVVLGFVASSTHLPLALPPSLRRLSVQCAVPATELRRLVLLEDLELLHVDMDDSEVSTLRLLRTLTRLQVGRVTKCSAKSAKVVAIVDAFVRSAH